MRLPRTATISLALVLGGLLAQALPGPARAAESAWRGDLAAAEAVRLINGERSYRGLRTLYVDRLLTDKARDGALRCPNDSTKVMAGRARDMALSGVFSHGLRLCGTKVVNGTTTYRYTALDLYASWGYNTYRAEILARNNYPMDAKTYRYGCRIDGTGCSTTKTTTASASVAVAMSGWMRSSAHRGAILGKYDRVGCGAWFNASAGRKVYTCLFSLGGPDNRDLTSPTVSARTGAGTTISAPTTFAATFADTWRLARGRVTLDGRTIGSWGFDYNVKSYRASVVVDPATLTAGTHTLVWRAGDAANRSSTTTSGTVVFTVRRP